MKAFVSPHSREDNKYIELMIKSLQKAGIEVVSRQKLKKEFPHIKFFIFNWIEGFQSNNAKVACAKKITLLLFLKAMGKKVVWTLHNRQPHDLVNTTQLNFMKFMAKISDKIIIHSKESLEVINNLTDGNKKYIDKAIYIPHPNYIGAYPIEYEKYIKDENKLKFLFVGAVKPYKNVEILIEAFKAVNRDAKIELLIAGKAASESYKNYIIKLVEQNSNINLRLEFIPDEELVNVINNNDVLILPYDLKSSLNSGTVILAFSNKKTVISPLIGTLKDYNKKDFFYSYTYENIEQHKEKLIEVIYKAIEDYTNNKDNFKEKGQIAYEEVKKYNSLEAVSEALKKGLLA